MRIQVPLDRIDDNPHQPRMSLGDIEADAESILQHGLRQVPEGRLITLGGEPIAPPRGSYDVLEGGPGGVNVLSGSRDERVQIAAGHRRVEMVRLLNDDDTVTDQDLTDAGLRPGYMPVEVSALSDDEMLDILTVENARREGLSPIEQARVIESHADAGRSGAQIASVFGRSESWVSNRKRLLWLPSYAQEYLHEGTISARQGQALVLAFRLQDLDPHIVNQVAVDLKPGTLLDEAIDGMTSDEIRQRVDQLESAVDTILSGGGDDDVRAQKTGGETTSTSAPTQNGRPEQQEHETPGDDLPDANDDLGIGEPPDAGDIARKNAEGEGWAENGEADDAGEDESSEEAVTDQSRLAAALFNLVLEVESEVEPLPEPVSTQLQSARHTYRQVTGQSIIASLPGDADDTDPDDSAPPLDTDRVDAILDDPSEAGEGDLAETFTAYRVADEWQDYQLTKQLSERARELFGVVTADDIDDDTMAAIHEAVERRAEEVVA